MNTNKEDMRELAAQLYALVVSTMTGNELQMAVHNLVKITKDNHVSHRSPPPYVPVLIYFIESFTLMVLLHHRVLRLSMGPSWLSATWWEGT